MCVCVCMVHSLLQYSKLAQTGQQSQQWCDATFSLSVFSEGHSKDFNTQRQTHHSYSTYVHPLWST